MPLESIACTNCGSTDVQEVKPSTYFCRHCETVFKHLDPTRVTIDHTPSFCKHGNPVEVQCQICKAGMCRDQCDIGPEIDMSREAKFMTGQRIPTAGFGYFYMDGGGAGSTARGEGPFLPERKLAASLQLKYGELHHFCYDCMIAAVPATADYITSGELCNWPACVTKAAAQCSCCGSAFCADCMTDECLVGIYGIEHGTYQDLESGQWLRWKAPLPEILIQLSESSAAKQRLDPVPCRVEWRVPQGLCYPCAREKGYEAAETARRICEHDYAGRLVKFEGERSVPAFWVPAATRMTRNGQLKETLKARKTAWSYAAEIGHRLQDSMAADGKCRRTKLATESSWTPQTLYVILDDRGHVQPSAVPPGDAAR